MADKDVSKEVEKKAEKGEKKVGKQLNDLMAVAEKQLEKAKKVEE